MTQKNNHSLTGRTQAKQAEEGTGKRLLATLLMLCLVLTAPCISSLAETADAVSGNSAADVETTSTGDDAVMNGNGNTEPKEADPESQVTGENSDNSGNNDGSSDSRDNAVSDNAVPVLPETKTGMPSNPVHHHTGENNGTDTTTWSYVYFGSYPQGEVTDESIKTAIDNAISQGNGQPAGTAGSSGGTDVWIGNIKYRRISKEDCNYSGYFDEVENNGYRYFKWERIKWRVLQNDGSTLFVAADMALDCKKYNDASYTDITWENCTLRSWLNNSFYQTAFTGAEQGAIVAQTVVNKDNPVYGTGGGNDTTDNVCLLSIGEVTDAAYGFCSDYNVYSDSRRLKASDYANARGAYRNTSTAYKGNCYWWLRSPGYSSNCAAGVSSIGYVDRRGSDVDIFDDVVVPALHINLSSDRWFMVDDGTSGSGGEDNRGNSSMDVKASGIRLTGISKKIAAGKKIKLTAEVLPENAADKAVTWTSSNPKYATVDANGVVRTKKAGAKKTVTITATAKDGSGVRAEYKIKIMRHAVRKVKITTSAKSVKAGKNLKLKATVTTTGKNANKKLKWTSSNESYATVSSKGVVKATKAGKGKTVTITAMATDGTGKKAKIKVKIQ